jgi:hypothetical protein
MMICDIIARMFMCTPYAKRKSHKSRTSERGGVQAEKVRTADIREIYNWEYRERRTTRLGVSFGEGNYTALVQFCEDKCQATRRMRRSNKCAYL